MNPPTIALLPGMGADARLFAPQLDHFENLYVPDWLPPHRRETMSQYAQRLAESLSPAPDIIGGCSFGGMITVEMMNHVNAKACVLISSVRMPSELPRRIRLWSRPRRSSGPACASTNGWRGRRCGLGDSCGPARDHSSSN